MTAEITVGSVSWGGAHEVLGVHIVHGVLYLVPWKKNLDFQISFLCQMLYVKAGTL